MSENIAGCVYPNCNDGLDCPLSEPPSDCPLDIEMTKEEIAKDATRERMLRWRKKHKEEIKEYYKQYYREHREAYRKYHKAHHMTPEQRERNLAKRREMYDPEKNHYEYLISKQRHGRKMSERNLKDIEEYRKKHNLEE